MNPPRPFLIGLSACLSLTILGNGALAQTVPAVTPASTQATTQATTIPVRPRLVLPPGFVRLDIEGRRLLIHPENEAFIRAAVAAAEPAKRPTTMPADLVTRVKQAREELIKGLAADLRAGEEATTKYVDTVLIPMLQDQDKWSSANVYLIAPYDRYKQIGLAGWENPGFNYNRLTGEARMTNTVIPVSDPDQIDSLIFLTINAAETDPEKRKTDLAAKISRVDSVLLEIKATKGLSSPSFPS